MFDWISKMFQERKVGEEVAIPEVNTKIKGDSKKEAEEVLQEARRFFTTETCPIRKGKCFSSCVHYYSGGIKTHIIRGYHFYCIDYPKCKLWNGDHSV